MATSSKQQSTSAAPLLGEESLCSASATAWKRTVMAKQHNAPASTLTVPRRPPPPVPPRPKRKPVPWGQQTDSLVFSNPAPFVKGSDADNDLSRPVQVDHVVYIAVVGATGSGKSSFINNVTGCREIIIADGLMSGTRHVNEATVQIGSTSVHLVDTPGFNDTELDDEEVCYMLIDWIKEFNLKGLKFSGLLYLHPMNKTREKGSDVQSLKVFKRLIGYENYGNITIGLTFCDLEAADVVAAREQALRESSRFWGDMVAAGAKVVRIPGSKRDAVHLVAQMLNNSTMTLQVEKELQTKPPEAVSAMEEMKDHRELQLIRLKSEMEEATQQILFEERMNLTSQFSTERAALEQQLFEERQAKQFLEGEVLLLKNMVEAEKEDARILKLQHNREEELKKQKAEQDEREKQAREEKEKLECEAEARKEQEANEHARSQIAKIFAYLYSKVTIMRKITNANPAVKRQEVRAIGTSGGAQWHAGLVCHVCWKLFQANEPILAYKYKGEERLLLVENVLLDICTNSSCLATAHRYLPDSDWEKTWHFPLVTSMWDCNRLRRSFEGGVCSRCTQKITGHYLHCGACDNDDFDICLKCWAWKGLGCWDREEHSLILAYHWEEAARYKIEKF